MKDPIKLSGGQPSRRQFVLTLGISAATAAQILKAQQAGDDDVVLRAMRDELERSKQLRVVGASTDELPYFLSYSVSDADVYTASAILGSLISSGRSVFRSPSIQVRVGSYDFDNTGHIRSGVYLGGSRYDTQAWPIENNYKALREALWLATDHSYKAAVESIARKRSSLKNTAQAPDQLPDFAKRDAVKSILKIDKQTLDEAAWAARTAKASAVFKPYPEVLSSGVDFQSYDGVTYLVNTEGTEIRYADRIAWLTIRAEGQAPDGMIIRDGVAVHGRDAKSMPAEATLLKESTDVAERIKARAKAPLGDPNYSGPVLFEPLAAAQLLAQILVDSLRMTRKPVSDPNTPVNYSPGDFEGRLNARVLPDWMDVVDDATLTTWQGKPLLGSYPFDTEGVPPKRMSLVEKGILKAFLATRQPTKNFNGSTGHARMSGNFGNRSAVPSNLFITASESKPLTDLRAQMIQMCKDRDKPYGFVVKRLDFPFSGSGGDLQSLMAGQPSGSRGISPPSLIYKVFPDGREELVRGVRFRGFSARSLRDILVASAETAQLDFLNNGVPLAIMGVGGMIAPTSVIAPGLLLDDMELERMQDPLPKLPIVPPPSTA